MARDFFPCYHSYFKKCEKLTDQELGRLFRALLKYSTTGERQELAGRESIAFDFIADDIDRVIENGIRQKGIHHWNWKGGITPQNQIGRSSKEYSAWRKTVFARDNFTCQACGQVGGNLNAHHIKSWAEYIDLRYVVDNGITLCDRCHKEIHRSTKCRDM